jgi:transposase
MIAFPSGARVWLATGHTDMRKGFGSLALMVQEAFKRSSAIRMLAICGSSAGEEAT